MRRLGVGRDGSRRWDEVERGNEVGREAVGRVELNGGRILRDDLKI